VRAIWPDNLILFHSVFRIIFVNNTLHCNSTLKGSDDVYDLVKWSFFGLCPLSKFQSSASFWKLTVLASSDKGVIQQYIEHWTLNIEHWTLNIRRWTKPKERSLQSTLRYLYRIFLIIQILFRQMYTVLCHSWCNFNK
jgi:hypothetical protein